MIDLERMKRIGIRNYLFENQMVTGLEEKRMNHMILFEDESLTLIEEQKEDIRLHNEFKHTSIHKQITEELKNNKDKEEKPMSSIEYRTKKVSLDITSHSDLTTRTTLFNIRGNKISEITKIQREREK